MSLTPEQRSIQNKLNAEKSTGPKTQEGKDKARENALKHGMTAKILALPYEDPEKIAARETQWNNYYNPQSPGAQHLVHLCVASTVMTDRVASAYDAAVASQVRNADCCWVNAKNDILEDLKILLVDNPAMGYRMLRREAQGCDYLIKRWQVLGKTFTERGYWSLEECSEIMRMMGVTPTVPGIKANADAFKIYFYNNLIPCDDRAMLAEQLLTDEIRPHELWNSLTAETLPDFRGCQTWIMSHMTDRIAELTRRCKLLAETIDTPDRAGAKARALMLKDEKDARLFLRYTSEARNGFHRAFRDLLKVLKSDGEMAEKSEKSGETEASRNEADFGSNWNPEDRFDPMLAVLKQACGAPPDPEMEGSRNEAELEEEDEENELAEAKTEGEKRFLQQHRDLMAKLNENISPKRPAL